MDISGFILFVNEFPPSLGQPVTLCVSTPPNPSTNDIMVGSSSKHKCVRQIFCSPIATRLVIYYEFEKKKYSLIIIQVILKC